MYNDYYLEQINTKLNSTNSMLDDIIENQEVLISGDIYIERKLEEVKSTNIMLTMAFVLYLIMYFIVRCLK